MTLIEKAFGKKEPITPTSSPESVLNRRTMGDMASMADIQRKYDPNMPQMNTQSPINTTSAVINKEGTPSSMAPEPTGFLK